MNAYVTIDENWGFSYKDKPIVSIPAEEKSRTMETAGKVIVYGLKYIPNLLGKQPVAGCINVIYTEGVKHNFKPSDKFFFCDTIEDVRKTLEKFPSEDINIIDNEKLYREFMPMINTVHVTKIDYAYKADAFFENLDKNPDFKIVHDSDEQYCFDIVYNFLEYERRK